MECPNAYQPKLDANGKLWKEVQLACFQTFSRVHWHPGKSQWYFQACKFHIFQAVLRRAVSECKENPEFVERMKRGLETENTELYVFSTNADINYKLTPEERGFLRAIHLEEFVTAVSWGVLHPQLVREAIASLEPTTLTATVKGQSQAILSKEWRTQFQQVFHLELKPKQPVTKRWSLAELFPSVDEKTGKHETVRITDCVYPGAKRPLRLLSCLFCLNSTHQHHIATSFAENILAALNGRPMDWPQEFYYEISEELLALHAKHRATRVKAGKTSVGPHVTLILKASGVFDIREEMEAGYKTSKALTIAEQVPHPKRQKSQAVKGPGSQLRIRVPPPPSIEISDDSETAKTPTAQVYSTMPQAKETEEVLPQKEVLGEPAEPGHIPKTLPPMIDQICQAHCRLENLLISFTTKAPSRFVNQMNAEFFRVQREAILQQDMNETDDTQIKVLLEAQGAQLQHLATQLANSESLNDLNIEAIFQLDEDTAKLERKLYLTAEEVLSLTAQKGEALGKLKTLQEKMDAQLQQIASKDQEITDLNNHCTDLQGMLERSDRLVTNQKVTIARLESQIATSHQEMADLTSEDHKLAAEMETGLEPHQARNTPHGVTHSAHPIMNRERHTLAAGIANRLLNELRRELAHTQEEKADLLKTIVADYKEFTTDNLPQSVKWTGTEFCLHVLKHIAPLNSIMQYHRVCGGLHLLLSNIPALKTGCHLEFSQFEAIWNQADAAAKDTLAFMWCLNDLKVPVGAMETISGSPPFYIKRYILRCLTLLSRHHHMTPAPREAFPTLRSYSHGQYYSVRDFQRSKLPCFDQALATLATADTSICYEAVQHYQAFADLHPEVTLQPTLSQIKHFVTKTLDEQNLTLTSRRFGTINSSTLLLISKDQLTERRTGKESIGTCFL